MSLEEFAKTLKYHDWFYMYADDSRAYNKGRDESMKIQSLLREFKERGLEEESMKLYEEYKPK